MRNAPRKSSQTFESFLDSPRGLWRNVVALGLHHLGANAVSEKGLLHNEPSITDRNSWTWARMRRGSLSRGGEGRAGRRTQQRRSISAAGRRRKRRVGAAHSGNVASAVDSGDKATTCPPGGYGSPKNPSNV